MHDNHFWIIVNLIAASVFCFGLLMCVRYEEGDRLALKEMIESGVDPGQAWCAINLSADSSAEVLTCYRLFFPDGDPRDGEPRRSEINQTMRDDLENL